MLKERVKCVREQRKRDGENKGLRGKKGTSAKEEIQKLGWKKGADGAKGENRMHDG